MNARREKERIAYTFQREKAAFDCIKTIEMNIQNGHAFDLIAPSGHSHLLQTSSTASAPSYDR